MRSWRWLENFEILQGDDWQGKTFSLFVLIGFNILFFWMFTGWFPYLFLGLSVISLFAELRRCVLQRQNVASEELEWITLDDEMKDN